MSSFMECADGHRCENGAICTENPYDEGAFYCDCDEALFDQAVAGLYCEHGATTYCTFNQEISRISFCTNEGTCKVSVSPEEAHLGCDCPSNYEGEHCQFVKGTKPEGWPFDGSNQGETSSQIGYPTLVDKRNARNDEGLHAGIIAVIVLVVLGIVGSAAYFVYTKQKKAEPLAKETVKIPDLALEADGSVLQQAVNEQNGGEPVAAPSSPSETGAMEDIKISEDAEKPEIV